jgi:hypothetical protein
MWCLPVRNGTATLTLGSAVGGRVSFNSNDDHDAMDGELVCRVLQLMQLTDNRLTQVTGSYQNMMLVDAKIMREFCRNSTKYNKVSDFLINII